VTEHIFMIAALIFIAAMTLIAGYLVYRVHRKSDQIEGIVAAVYLQARRVLEQYRP
jgi:flagellar biogenesis protein FliO